jgi:hypothetical protein
MCRFSLDMGLTWENRPQQVWKWPENVSGLHLLVLYWQQEWPKGLLCGVAAMTRARLQIQIACSVLRKGRSVARALLSTISGPVLAAMHGDWMFLKRLAVLLECSCEPSVGLHVPGLV